MANLSRVEEINKTIAASPLGYLGISQDASALPKVPSVSPSTPTKPVAVLSTENASNKVTSQLNTLNSLSPTTAPNYQAPPTDPKTQSLIDTYKKNGSVSESDLKSSSGSQTTGAKTEPKTYFVNENGQEAEYTQEQLNDPKIQAFIANGGYVQTKTEGLGMNPTNPLQEKVNSLDKIIEDAIVQFGTYNVDNDPVFSAQASAIRGQFDVLRNETKKNNEAEAASLRTIGLRSGISRYAGQNQTALMGEELAQANNRLSKINADEASSISTARTAYQSGKFAEFSRMVDNLQILRTNKAEALKNYTDTIQKAIEHQREDAKSRAEAETKVTESISKVMETASSHFAPDEVLQKIANAKTVQEAIMAAGEYAGDSLDKQLKLAQIDQAKAATSKSYADAKATADEPAAKKALAKSETLNSLSLVDSLLESPYLSQVTGLKNPFTYWTPGSNEQMAKNQLSQIISVLSLENRQKLKGSGAISDFEAMTLQKASSALGKNLSDQDAKKELKKVRGVMATASGLPATVLIKDPKSGQSKVMEATRDGIEQAVIDGLLVEYQ